MMNKTDINFTPTGDLSLFFFFLPQWNKEGMFGTLYKVYFLCIEHCSKQVLHSWKF